MKPKTNIKKEKAREKAQEIKCTNCVIDQINMIKLQEEEIKKRDKALNILKQRHREDQGRIKELRLILLSLFKINNICKIEETESD